MKSRGFPVTSLPCNNTVAEVWNTNLKVGMMTVMVIPNNCYAALRAPGSKNKNPQGASTLYDRGPDAQARQRAALQDLVHLRHLQHLRGDQVEQTC